jgi:hypothetical protein
MTNLSVILLRPSHLRAALRLVVDLRVTKGMTISGTCEEAGMYPQGYHKEMKQPAVRNYLPALQRVFVARVEAQRRFTKRAQSRLAWT